MIICPAFIKSKQHLFREDAWLIATFCDTIILMFALAKGLSIFLMGFCAPIYGQKVQNTDVKSAPEGVANIRANGGLEHYTEKNHAK